MWVLKHACLAIAKVFLCRFDTHRQLTGTETCWVFLQGVSQSDVGAHLAHLTKLYSSVIKPKTTKQTKNDADKPKHHQEIVIVHGKSQIR